MCKNTIASVYNPKSNSFNIIRFFLAASVLYSHTFLLLDGTGVNEPLVLATKDKTSIGEMAVFAFFAISGFLITQSFENSGSIRNYLYKRCLRIFPAFFASLILSAFVLGPLVSSLTPSEYLLNQHNPFLFVIKSITFNIFGQQITIADVFLHNHFSGVVNASMWTIKYEFFCYIGIIFVYVLSVPIFKLFKKA